jgi:hypothetical protein
MGAGDALLLLLQQQQHSLENSNAESSVISMFLSKAAGEA